MSETVKELAARLGPDAAIAWADDRIRDLAKTLELTRFTRRVLADTVLREPGASAFVRDLAALCVEADELLRRGPSPSPAVGSSAPMSDSSRSSPKASSPVSPSNETQPPS